MMKQVSDLETKTILRQAEDCLVFSGDFVELGCFEGDTSLLLAELLKNHKSDKKLWIYDSFEGLPEKDKNDLSLLGKDFVKGQLFTTKAFVKKRFLRANLPVPIIKKAWFSELDPEKDLPDKIAFSFLDGDFYESIKTSLELVVPKMIPQGKIIVHDYDNPELPGVAKAVDDFFAGTGKKIEKIASLVIITT